MRSTTHPAIGIARKRIGEVWLYDATIDQRYQTRPRDAVVLWVARRAHREMESQISANENMKIARMVRHSITRKVKI